MEVRLSHTVLRTTHAAHSIELKVHNAQCTMGLRLVSETHTNLAKVVAVVLVLAWVDKFSVFTVFSVFTCCRLRRCSRHRHSHRRHSHCRHSRHRRSRHRNPLLRCNSGCIPRWCTAGRRGRGCIVTRRRWG